MGKKNQYKADSRLEASVVLILMKAGVTGPEIDECLLWAFGPGALYRPIYPDWFDSWHDLHPEYPAKKNMSFVEWITVVGFLFTQWKKVKDKYDKFNNN